MVRTYYCEFCKSYPSKIVEVYIGDVEEERIYNEETGEYDFDNSNMDGLDIEVRCGVCANHLIYREECKNKQTTIDEVN